MDGHRSKVKRWQVLAMAAAVIAAAALALPAFGSNKDVRIDPDATGGAGYTNLDALTYSAAKSRLDQLSEITLPVDIPGFDVLDVSGVALGSNDASRVLSLSGSASLALDGGTQDVDLLVTAIWPDDMSTTPNIAIAAKTDELSLSKVNRLWDDSYGDVNFATARLAVATEGHEIDPATLPAEAQDFYPEAVDLTGSLDFAGDLELSGRLADAFGYAGYSGEVELEGKLGGSAAALFGRATVDDLGALRLTATLGKSPTAPEWIHDRESIFEFVLDSENNYRPGLSVEEHVTIEVDNTTNEFRGSFSVAPTGAIEGKVGIANIGDFDAPFGLGEIASNLSSIELRLARDNGVTEGGLALGVVVDGTPDPVQVTADFVTDGGTTRANFAIEGDISVPTVVNLAGDVLGTEVVDFPGGDGVELNRVSFSFTTGAGQRTFSVGASATVKQLEADAVLTLRAATGQRAKPLLGLRLRDPGCNNGNGDCIRMSSLLPEGQVGDTLAGLVLPALTLTAAPDSLTELAAADLTRQEEEFFAATYDPLPDTLTFKRGVNLQGRLPVEALGTDVREALGYAEDAVVVLSGTLGAGTTVGGVDGGSASLNELELEAELPPATNSTILPDWVEPTGPTTLAFRYETGIALEFATAATVTIDDNPFQTTISGRLERANGRTSIDFDGTITDWQQPFGVSWIDLLDSATLGLHTSFGGGSATEIEAAVTATTTLDNKPFSLEFGLSKTDSTSAWMPMSSCS